MKDDELISTELKRLNKEYRQRQGLTPYRICDGYCEDFALELKARLEKLGICGQDVETYNFQDSETGVWHTKLLRKYWPKVIPPTPFNWKSLQGLFVSHIWFTYKGKHYDPECSEGVENFFDLPIFKRHLKALRKGG